MDYLSKFFIKLCVIQEIVQLSMEKVNEKVVWKPYISQKLSTREQGCLCNSEPKESLISRGEKGRISTLG